MRAPRPSIARAGLNRTLESLAGFAALAFLSLGIYLLADAFAHPVGRLVPPRLMPPPA